MNFFNLSFTLGCRKPETKPGHQIKSDPSQNQSEFQDQTLDYSDLSVTENPEGSENIDSDFTEAFIGISDLNEMLMVKNPKVRRKPKTCANLFLCDVCEYNTRCQFYQCFTCVFLYKLLSKNITSCV